MGIAKDAKVPDKVTATAELLKDTKNLKARQRANSFLKRRSAQFVNGHLPSSWSICTDLQRQWTSRRLRRLFQGVGGAAGKQHAGCKTGKQIVQVTKRETNANPNLLKQSVIWHILWPVLIILGMSCLVATFYNTDALSRFSQLYVSQYRSIVHNKMNYCSRNLPVHEIFERIRGDVLNQELALKQLKQAMSNHSSFQSIALVGSSGLGKSLTMRLLVDQYPWKENMHIIAWNDFKLINDEMRTSVVTCLLRNLAHCGRNLIIIDNMSPCDRDYVTSINEWVRARPDVAFDSNDEDKKQLTIIYVFNLNRYLGNELYDRQLEMVKDLPETTVIHYRPFGVKDLEMCVRHEAKVVGMYLDEEHIQELLNATEVKASGCKTVRSKVLMYAHPEQENEEANI